MIVRRILAQAVAATLLVSGFCGAAHAASQPDGAPPLTAGNVEAWLDGIVPYAVDTGDIAGAAIVVVKDGAVLAVKGYGFADLASRRPVDPARTLFRAASVSKLFTATAVMQQVERGKLDLDRDVQGYLDFPLPVRDDGPITLRHLLTHRAGFEERVYKMYAATPAEMLSLGDVMRAPPARIRKAGTVSSYSNYGNSLAGYIVERVTGVPFVEYIDREILQPLQMRRTSYAQPLPDGLQEDVATGYASVTQPIGFEAVSSRPSGSLSSSVLDMANFMIAHLQHGSFGEARILLPQTVAAMQAAQVTPVPGLSSMALGFYQRQRNGQLWLAHGGDLLGFHSDLNILPAQNIGYYVALNGSALGAVRLRSKLWTGFNDRYFPQASALPPALPTAVAHGALLAGRYQHTRNAETGFLALGGLLAQTQLQVETDGTLVTAGPNDLNRQPKRWREIEPFVWRELNGPNRLIAVVENGTVLRFNSDDVIPVLEFHPVPFSHSFGWILPALLAATTVIVLILVAAATRGVRRLLLRRRGGEPVPAAHGGRAAVVTAALLLVFALGWAWLVTRVGVPGGIDGRLDPWIRLLQFVLLGAVGGLGLTLVHLVQGPLPARQRRARILARGLLLLAGLFVTWFAWTFNLLQLRLAY